MRLLNHYARVSTAAYVWRAKQLERDTMIEKTRAGLAAAAANARNGGRPRKVDGADAAKVRSLRDKGITTVDIGKMLGVSRATVCAGVGPSADRLSAWVCLAARMGC